jgi:hypothetical protein
MASCLARSRLRKFLATFFIVCRLAAPLHSRSAMPTKATIEKARRDEREGKAPSTQAGEFVHEEIDHVREGKHGARNTKQAIAIGLSKARRAGVKLPPPSKSTTSATTRRKAQRDAAVGAGQGTRRTSPTRSRATVRALKREGSNAASRQALSKQAKQAATSRRRAGRKSA